jgi:(2Fe-2S) ferredoxin
MSEYEKINSAADLDRVKERFGEESEKYDRTLLFCSGSGCVSSNCIEVRDALISELEEAGLSDSVKLSTTGCIGICEVGPRMTVMPDGVFYCKLKPEDMKKIVKKHLLEDQICEEFCYTDRETGKKVPQMKDIAFFKGQNKTVLRDCGMISHKSIEEFIYHDGYYALAKALNKMTPQEVIDEVKKSGLRGRGGGGFSTGVKWSLAARAPGDQKYIICNADEGDPGAFMDRSLLEGNSHAVLEGMAIAGYAVGARDHFTPVEKPPPPLPRSPDFLTSSTTS